eukprot:g950.t1
MADLPAIPASTTPAEAAASYATYGLFWMKDALGPAGLKLMKDAASQRFYEVLRALVVKQAIANTKGEAPPVSYAEITERDGGRYDSRFGFDAPPLCGLLREGCPGSALAPLLKAALGDDCMVVNRGQMVALPPCAWLDVEADDHGDHGDQQWHTDARKTMTNTDACTVFFPLVDLTESNGPTQFVLKSHKSGEGLGLSGGGGGGGGDGGEQEAKDNEDARRERDSSILYLPAGAAVAFDYRLWHRGRANNSEADRPMLYAICGRPVWKTLTAEEAAAAADGSKEGEMVKGLPVLDRGSEFSMFGGAKVTPPPPFPVGAPLEIEVAAPAAVPAAATASAAAAAAPTTKRKGGSEEEGVGGGDGSADSRDSTSAAAGGISSSSSSSSNKKAKQ